MLPILVTAQFDNYRFVNYTTKEGLINDAVIKCIQDKHGFLWIATLNGLSKFDGKFFTNYFSEEANPKSLRSNWITDLLIDKNGIIWVSTEWGICWYNEREDNFCYINELNTIYTLYKTPMCLDKQGNIWAAAENGLIKINTVSKKYETTSLSRIADPQSICLFNNEIYIGTRGHHFYIYNYEKNSYSIFNEKEIAANTHIMNFFEDEQGLWAATSIGLININHQKKIQVYNQLKTALQSTIVDGLMSIVRFKPLTGDSLLLCGSYGKELFFFNKNKKIFIAKWKNENRGLDDLHYGIFNNLFVANNILWFSTSNGLSKLNFDEQDYYTVSLQNLKPSNENNILIKQILAQKNNENWWLLVGMHKGYLGIFNHKENKIIIPKVGMHSNYVSLLNHENYTYAIRENAIDKFDAKGNLIKTYESRFWPYCAAKFYDEKIIVGTDAGIATFNFRTNNFELFELEYKGTEIENNSFSAKFIANDIIEADEQSVWIASIKYGLFNYNFKQKKLTPYRQPSNLLYETKNRVSSIVNDNNGNLWLGTMNGIAKFNLQSKRFENFGNKHGLNNTYVYSLKFLPNKIIWGRGNTGVFSCDVVENRFTNFSLDNKLNNFFSFQKVNIIEDKAVIGFEGGFVAFKNYEKKQVKNYENIVLNKFYVLNEKIDFDKDSIKHNPVALKHYQNTLSFSFSSINHQKAQLESYSYLLEGFNKNWNFNAKNTTINYTNLPPGKYNLFVKQKLENSNWSSPFLLASFEIKPAIWQRWWFLFLASFIVLGTLFLLIQWWQKNKLNVALEKNRNQQLITERLKAELENEQITHFFTNSLVNKNNIDEVLWDVAKNLIGKLGFVDCMIYLWNDDKTKLIQKAGYGPKGSIEEINKLPFDVILGQGVVGYVAEKKEAVIINDTTKDERYRVDEMNRLSEICLPIMYNDELIGIIDSEHHEKNFYNERHLQILTTIATLIANKIKSIEAENKAKEKEIALESVSRENVELQLAALRSQMNPHFIFNSLNSIQKYIWENKQEDASEYLTKFAKLIRMILEHSAKKLITLEEEIIALQLYLELEHRRCNNKFDYSLNTNFINNTSAILIQPMLIQPHIENAIWHGLLQKEERGLLSIKIALQENHSLKIIIQDDGIGRQKSSEINKRKEHKSSSFGINITEKRLNIANTLGLTGNMQIEDLYDENGKAAGTIITLYIPVETFEKIK